MEGEADRREGEDSPEGQSDRLDDYRNEIGKMYPDSGDDGQGRAQPNSGEGSDNEDCARGTQLVGDSPEAGRSLEHSSPSLDTERKSEPNTVKSEMVQEYDPSAKLSTREDTVSELERLREEINEKQEGLGDGAEPAPRKDDGVSATSLEEKGDDAAERWKMVVSDAEVRDRGGKIESSQTDSEKGVATKNSARGVDSDVREDVPPDAIVERAREKKSALDQSQTEVELAGNGLHERKPDSRETAESPTMTKIPDSRSVIEGKGLEKASVAELSSDKESKAAGESRTIRDSQTSLAKESGNRYDKSKPKLRTDIADLEGITEIKKESWTQERKKPDARTMPGASHPEWSQQEKLDRADAIPVNANRHQSNPPVICFDIPKQAIEEKTGVRMDEGKLYQIRGNVVGKYDFEMYRTVGSYVRHFVPVEHHHQIQAGKVHDIRITSVKEVPLTKAQSELVSEWRDRGVPWNRIAYRINHMQPEHVDGQTQPAQDSDVSEKKKLHQLEKLERVDNIGATFVAESRLQKGDLANPRDRFYFRIDNSEYKQKTGVAIDEGATYKISGEIEGVGQFEKKLRSVAAGQDMPIYVPHELKSKIGLGKEYKITINSVERIPSVRDSWEKLERPSIEWTWKEIASWIDTEGRINSKTGFYSDIAQKDKRVIEEICGFYDEHGLHPNMTLQKSVGCYHARLARVDDVATVIKNIEPYIRTENKKEQIQQFKERLSAPRKSLQSGIREARKILELE